MKGVGALGNAVQKRRLDRPRIDASLAAKHLHQQDARYLSVNTQAASVAA
jgi:hypothetical protein